MSYHQVAGTVIRDPQGRYLLVQEKLAKVYGLWNLPAGHVDEGETPAQAAVRETLEEVGLDIELTSDEPILTGSNELRQHTFFAFRTKSIDKNPIVNTKEILTAQWWTFHEIKELFGNGKLRDRWIWEAIKAVEKS